MDHDLMNAFVIIAVTVLAGLTGYLLGRPVSEEGRVVKDLVRHMPPRHPGGDIDVLLTEQRDERAAKHFPTKAIHRHGMPETITIDGREANAAAIKSYNKEHGTSIETRQIKYLNNIIEQDHRGVKRVTQPMLGFKVFEAAQSTLVGIELMHML